MKVKRHRLLLLSGVMWSLVGIMLVSFAVRWFPEMTKKQVTWAIVIGLLWAFGKVFMFRVIARKNISRILTLPHKTWIWTFQKWTSYLIIVFMMTLGISLRTTGLVEKKYLAPMYIGIGLALFLSSFNYYKQFFKEHKMQPAYEIEK